MKPILALPLSLLIVRAFADVQTAGKSTGGATDNAKPHVLPADAVDRPFTIFTNPPLTGGTEHVIQQTAESKLGEWQKELNRVRVGNQLLWIVERDTLMDDQELAAHSQEYVRQRQQIFFSAKATAMAHTEMSTKEPKGPLPPDVEPAIQGKGSRWPRGTTLTYAVSRPSFQSSDNNYNLVVQKFQTACNEWQKLCGIRFKYDSQKDSQSPSELLQPGSGVDFVVQFSSETNNSDAIAFFPFNPRDRRLVSFYRGFFGWADPDMQSGICRHEVGHILGFGHEHDSPVADPACPKSLDSAVYTIGKYDVNSVMHYSCGSNSNIMLEFTSRDRTVAKQIYGPP